MATQPIVRERVGETSFIYRRGNKKVSDTKTSQWIQSLVIPPAWNEVEIFSPRSKVLARGKDEAGRTQAIYNPSFRMRQEAKKFSRLTAFGKKLPKLRRIVKRDLRRRKLTKEKVVATALRLIDQTYFRVGNPRYAAENNSYGVTTLRSKHVDIHSYTVTFDFVGKSKKRHTKTIADRTLARILKQLDETPGEELFRYEGQDGDFHTISSHDINDYIKIVMGSDFSAKDFRTWGGTLHAITLLSQCESTSDPKERKKHITTCVKKVARRLGNTPAIARGSYIDPYILEGYLAGKDLFTIVSTTKPNEYLLPEEQIALAVLKT